MIIAPGTLFAEDFRIVQRIGVGGMGSVYVAEQISTGRRRALKLMLPQIVESAELRRRFEQEARIGSRIESEHVVEVVGAGVDEASGTPWLAMELLIGEDLSTTLERRGALDVSEVRTILEQMCHALGAAHAAGIVHRDLKPENIFLAETKRANQSRMVKVLDFGIAKLVAEATTRHTAAVGSPSWMAPEQSERGSITAAADVWSIGLLAFTLLTNQSFWLSTHLEGATIQQVMKETLFEAIPPASVRAEAFGVAHLLPPWFDAWFARCLHRDPRERLQNATEAWRALQGLVQPEPPPMLQAPLLGARTTRATEEESAPTDPLAPPLVMPPRFETQTALATETPRPSRALPLLVAVTFGSSAVAFAAFWMLKRPVPPPVPAPADSQTSSPDDSPITVDLPPPLPSPSGSVHGPTRKKDPGALVVVAGEPFNRTAAAAAMKDVDIAECKKTDGPSGPGHVACMFEASGKPSSCATDPPFMGTPTGECIAKKYYKTVRVPAFDGDKVRVGKAFTLR